MTGLSVGLGLLGIGLTVWQLAAVRRLNLVPLLLGVLVAQLSLVGWAVAAGFGDALMGLTGGPHAVETIIRGMGRATNGLQYGGLIGLATALLTAVAAAFRANLRPRVHAEAASDEERAAAA